MREKEKEKEKEKMTTREQENRPRHREDGNGGGPQQVCACIHNVQRQRVSQAGRQVASWRVSVVERHGLKTTDNLPGGGGWRGRGSFRQHTTRADSDPKVDRHTRRERAPRTHEGL
jgi:hypothetical protein